jgi:hypothetical protein
MRVRSSSAGNRNKDTYTSHLYPDGVVVGKCALQVLGQLGGVRVLPHRVQPDQVRLKQNEKPNCRQFWL